MPVHFAGILFHSVCIQVVRSMFLGVYLRPVTYLRQFGVLVLLLASCVSPTMACMVPDAPMTNEERACCRMMKNQCDQQGMPASHECCKKIPASVYDKALKTNAIALRPVAIRAIWLTASELLNPTSVVTGWTEHLDYSPPKHPPSTISILRI